MVDFAGWTMPVQYTTIIDEHLAILDLLAVPAAVVALTKIDLIDDETREIVLNRVARDEDMVALLSLVDFAKDEEIRRRATMVLDLLLLDLAHHLFKGVFGSTHGRAYEISKKWARKENTADVAKLHFGVGCFGSPECMSAPGFVLSKKTGEFDVTHTINELGLRDDPMTSRKVIGLLLGFVGVICIVADQPGSRMRKACWRFAVGLGK